MGAACSGLAEWPAARMVAVVLAIGAACSHGPAATPAPVPPPPPCPPAEPLRLNVSATARLNPGEKGEALATVVRLYQLKGIGKLAGVSFDDLLDHDKEALGEEFSSVKEITINPGDAVDPRFTRDAEATFLMAVALFRRPAGTTWKVIKKLPPPDPNHCRPDPKLRKGDEVVRLLLDENRIELR